MKIASWNVSGFRKSKSLNQFDYEKTANLSYFIEKIKMISPDILLIQESLANKTTSLSKEIGSKTEMPYFHDVMGTKSYIDPNYFESTSFISKVEIIDKTEIRQINPNWEVVMENGHLAKSFDRSYQIVETEYGKIVNVHFLPEKFFKKDYIVGDGKEYIDKNLAMISELDPPFFFCGDLNTRHINEVFGSFFDKNRLVNAFKNIPTRPISEKEALPQDVIAYPKDIILKDRGIVEVDTDHYLIWADFG